MSTPEEWGCAFAKQAKADFNGWNALHADSPLPECQKLHFLQMACEKLCKAYLCKAGSDPLVLQTSHAYTAKNLPIILRQQISLMGDKAPKNSKFLIQRSQELAREIELLAPSVDDGGRRPDNCEYPWEKNGKLYVPAEWSFSNLKLLAAPAGRTILKLIQDAISRLA
jgi:hypothetical protein